MIRKFLKEETGNVESAMVLIPLVFLFLCSIQLVSAVFIRNTDQSEVQSQASTRAISGIYERTDSVLKISSNNSFDDQSILVVSKRREIPIFIPGLIQALGRRLQSDVTGVAVIEGQP